MKTVPYQELKATEAEPEETILRMNRELLSRLQAAQVCMNVHVCVCVCARARVCVVCPLFLCALCQPGLSVVDRFKSLLKELLV